MNKTTRRWMLSLALAATLSLSGGALAFQTPAAKTPAKGATPKAADTPAPSDKDIADAKAKGLVWVNTSSKVYHKDGEFYGKTKRGKFMSESDAVKDGNRAAKPPMTKKAKPAK